MFLLLCSLILTLKTYLFSHWSSSYFTLYTYLLIIVSFSSWHRYYHTTRYRYTKSFASINWMENLYHIDSTYSYILSELFTFNKQLSKNFFFFYLRIHKIFDWEKKQFLLPAFLPLFPFLSFKSNCLAWKCFPLNMHSRSKYSEEEKKMKRVDFRVNEANTSTQSAFYINATWTMLIEYIYVIVVMVFFVVKVVVGMLLVCYLFHKYFTTDLYYFCCYSRRMRKKTRGFVCVCVYVCAYVWSCMCCVSIFQNRIQN